MNFQQLRIIRETVRQNFNLTEVGNALYTSQSGVSKHIKDLEDELGVALFERKGKRLLGLTKPGSALLVYVERMLLDAKNIKQLAAQLSQREEGQLTIATTHTQARYALPAVIHAFKEAFPKVRLALHQSSPEGIAQMLLAGEADIGIATEVVHQNPDLASFAYYKWHHSVVVRTDHPLMNLCRAELRKRSTQADAGLLSDKKQGALSLADIAQHPLITYHEGFTGRSTIDAAFDVAQETPDVVMTALDADVIKTYVELGMGVGIIASMAYEAQRDKRLRLLPSQHLFGQNTTYIALRREQFLPDYAYAFIQLCNPELNTSVVRSALCPQD